MIAKKKTESQAFGRG